jgi:hypothetical protein
MASRQSSLRTGERLAGHCAICQPMELLKVATRAGSWRRRYVPSPTRAKLVLRRNLPPGLEVIDRVENPVDKAQLLLLMYLIYRIGPLAASVSVLAGAPMKAAYAVHDLMIMALALEAEEICAAWGIGRFAFTKEPGIFNFDVFDKANWERLAELAGEPMNVKAWKAWARQRGTASPDAS